MPKLIGVSKQMDILLIRHGETHYNTEHRIYGHAQIPLNERGKLQAQAVANRLKDTPIDAIYSSDLVRAYATAQSIAAHHPLVVNTDAGFREVDVGRWEHLTEADVARTFATEYADFRTRPGEAPYLGGESFQQVQKRAWHVLERCIQTHADAQTICIVCHAGTISALICGILQVNINHHPRLRIDNCAISRLTVTSEGIHLATLNDNTHVIKSRGEMV